MKVFLRTSGIGTEIRYTFFSVLGLDMEGRRWNCLLGLWRTLVWRITRKKKKKKKKNWELKQCQLVAAEINESKGTDYDAHPSDAEPRDTTLKSKSGAHPLLPVQVVSIPLDIGYLRGDELARIQILGCPLRIEVPA